MKKIFFLLTVFLLMASAAEAGFASDSLRLEKGDSVFIIPSAQSNVDFFGEPADILDDGLILPASPVADSIQFYIAQAHAAIQKVRELNNYIKNIDEATKFKLPVSIPKEVGGVRYELIIHAIRLKPTHAELDVYLLFTPPQSSARPGQEATTLSFMAKGIKFTKKGGIVGDATLGLLGDYAINLNGDKSQIILKGGETYVTIDCDGFKEMSLKADVKFSRDLIRPEKPDGTQAEGNVTATFSTKLSSWNDLVVQLTLPTFQVTGLTGVSFDVQDAVFDFSDARNATNIQFPEGYQSTSMLPGNPNLWRGFYMRSLTVKLPPEFKQRGSTARTTFQASNVIIDNLGFTGKLSGTNVIPLQSGDMNGWAFSLDQLDVTLQANQLVEAKFSGGIVIPIGKEDRPFEYGAIINTGGNYLFHVSPATDMAFPLWGAGQVDIYEASYLDIRVVDHKFLPKASLNGRMGINAKLSEGGKGVELANITFEGLEIQSVKPYVKVGNFSFGSEAAQQKMAGFPISINNIGLRSISDTEVGLDFNLKLNLVGESNGAFAADAGLTIVGKIDADKGMQSWRYKTINVREIAVDIDGGAFKINGKLIFYRNDVSYGDGFNGNVKAEFTPGIKVTATAIFGNVNGFRYWYADAMVNFPTAIPIFPAVGIYGFGGGAYFGMKMDNQGLGSELGRTASGVVYVPDVRSGLGLKAIVNLGSMPKPEAFNADVTFEISFFQGGGVRYIAFGGNGYLVTPGLELNLDKMKGAASKMVAAVKTTVDKLPGAAKGLLDSGGDNNSLTSIFGEIGDKAGQKGQISARMMISFDFENRVLHGNFEVYVNVAGGIIKGVGPGGRAGWSVLHFAPNEWYVYAGTPDDRLGVSIGVGSLQVSATSYFMVGTKILNSPPPPPEVGRILGGVDLDYMKDLNSIGKGGGFAFGAALSLSTGEMTFLMFYASFNAGLGFDIMLKDYGEAYCKGSSKPLGINGWYANGQAYAYFEGAVGIKVKVFGVRKKIEILSIGAAAVLQAKLPNPFWMRGIVGGYFSVLGGMVKGNCKFEVTIGKECELIRDQNAILNDVEVIAEVTPRDGEKEVNVFTTPQAVFNMPIDKEFELVDEDRNNIKRKFRIHLDYFRAEIDKVAITGTTQWNDNRDVLALNPYEVFPSQKEVVIAAQVSFEEFKNNRWATVITDGQPVVQRKESKVVSGIAPDYIPVSNIEYCYPIIGQMNFYKEETQDGYIKLKQAQPYLFKLSAEWKQEGRFKTSAGDFARFDFVYTYATNLITFKIPANLKNNQVYAFDLLNLPANKAGAIDRNVSQVANKVNVEGESLDMEVSTKKADGSIEELQEKSILTYYLRTSSYNTFIQKIDNVNIPWPFQWECSNGVSKLYSNVTGSELFDQFETDPSRVNSTILFEAIPDNTWYNTIINPLMYDSYPIDGRVAISSRNVNVMGLPPTRSVYFLSQTDNIINQNTPDTYTPFRAYASLQYYFPVEIGNDYLNMRAVAANVSVNYSSPRINALLTASWKNVFPNDYYRVKASYVLPGTRKVTSEKIIPLYFTIVRN